MARPRLTEEQKYLRNLQNQELKKELAIRRQTERLNTKAYRELAKLELENRYKQKKILAEEKEKLRAKTTGIPTWAKSFYEKPKGKSFVKGFTQQFRQITASVPRQRMVSAPVVDVRQLMEQQQLRQPRPQNRNFFEHGSDLEVFGDEGLTFFDSEKRSQGRSTGSLFGLG